MKKRQTKRVPRRIQVQFAVEGEKKPRTGFTVNISSAGLFVGTNSPYPRGSLVQLKFLLDEPLETVARVVHSRKGVLGSLSVTGIERSGMGLRFLEPEARVAALVQQAATRPAQETRTDAAKPADAEVESPSEPASVAEPGASAAAAGPSAEHSEEAEHISSSEPDSQSPAKSAGGANIELTRLNQQLAAAKEEISRLQTLVEADEREKEMLRQLVSRLEADPSRSASNGETVGDREERPQRKEKDEIGDLARRHAAALKENEELRGQIRTMVASRLESEPPPPAPERPRTEDSVPAEAPHRRRVPGAVLFVLGGVLGSLLAFALLKSRPTPLAPNTTAAAPLEQAAESVRPAKSTAADQAAVSKKKNSGGSTRTPDVIANDPSSIDVGTADGAESDEPPLAPADEPVDETREEVLALKGPNMEALAEVVKWWAAAWSEQRVEDYLSFYSSEFETPEGLDREQWKSQRRQRIGRPEWIKVTLGPFAQSPLVDNRISVSFDQTYESPTYKDKGRKTLDFAWEDNTWRIVGERTSE